MPNTYRVYILCNKIIGLPSGFSETYEFQRDTDDAAKDVAQAITNYRRRILSRNWEVIAVKIATIAPKQRPVGGQWFAAATRVNVCPAIEKGLGGQGPGDIPGTAIFDQWQFVDYPKAGNRQFRGIPDIWWDNGGLTNDGIGAVQQFCDIMRSVPVGKLVVNKSNGASSFKALKCSEVRRGSTRRVGRPFGLLHGRQKKQPA